MDRYTVLYLKWIANKDLLYSTGNSAQYDEAAWMGQCFGGRMDMCMWMVESLHCSSEIVTTLLIGYSQYEIKSSKQDKKENKILC